MYEDVLYACDDDVCPEYTKDPRKLNIHSELPQHMTNISQVSRKLLLLPRIFLARTWRRTLSECIPLQAHFTAFTSIFT
jgi:hypothetical protein